MIKKLFIFLFLVLLAAYIIVAVTYLNATPNEVECKGVSLIIKDSINHGFINDRDILHLLKQKNISPIGKKMSEIDTRSMEEEIGKQPFIANVECYRTPGNKIGIEVTQRVPLLRIMSNNGENYYIDMEGTVMPVPNSAAHVAVTTGYITKEFASKELYELGLFLKTHPLWNAQIEQINVTPKKELELVPRVGEQIIFLGKPGDYEHKFNRLKFFYEEGLKKVGWNKYDRINLEFSNQIICTKRQK